MVRLVLQVPEWETWSEEGALQAADAHLAKTARANSAICAFEESVIVSASIGEVQFRKGSSDLGRWVYSCRDLWEAEQRFSGPVAR